MTHSFYLAVCALFGALSIAACGSSDAPATNANAGPHDNDHLPAGDIQRGKSLANQNSCAACHGADYSGSAFNANVTSATGTGIGSWTDAQVATAIRDGVEDNGQKLCALMERFPFSDQDTADVIAFLRSLPAVEKATTAACPGHGN